MAYFVREIEDVNMYDMAWFHVYGDLVEKYRLPMGEPSVEKVLSTITEKVDTILPESPCDAWLMWDEVRK